MTDHESQDGHIHEHLEDYQETVLDAWIEMQAKYKMDSITAMLFISTMAAEARYAATRQRELARAERAALNESR